MKHKILQTEYMPPFPASTELAIFGAGCFWSVEELFWQQKGIYTTAVGYAAGVGNNPSYSQVSTGKTGFMETVLVVFFPHIINYTKLLELFWVNHDPTQLNQQGNDVGSQYRSALIPMNSSQLTAALDTKNIYQKELNKYGCGKIVTEIIEINFTQLTSSNWNQLANFHYAEEYHQQYLAKNPLGYRCAAALQVPYPN